MFWILHQTLFTLIEVIKMTTIETKIKEWLQEELESSREVIAEYTEYTDENRPKCDDGSDDFIEGNYDTAQRLLLKIEEWSN